jgi:hypothetical protein
MSDRMSANDHWDDVQKMYNDLRNKGKYNLSAIKLVQVEYSGVGPDNQLRLQDGYKPLQNK